MWPFRAARELKLWKTQNSYFQFFSHITWSLRFFLWIFWWTNSYPNISWPSRSFYPLSCHIFCGSSEISLKTTNMGRINNERIQYVFFAALWKISICLIYRYKMYGILKTQILISNINAYVKFFRDYQHIGPWLYERRYFDVINFFLFEQYLHLSDHYIVTRM